MAGAEALVFLLVAVAVLAAFGLRYDVPYPIVLVVGGLVLVTVVIDVDEARVRSRGR